MAQKRAAGSGRFLPVASDPFIRVHIVALVEHYWQDMSRLPAWSDRHKELQDRIDLLLSWV